MIERESEHCTYLAFPSLAEAPGVVHAVFTRRGGYSAAPYQGLNLVTSTGDDARVVARNRAVVEDVIGLPVFAVKPVHGAEAFVLRREAVEDMRATQPETWTEALWASLRGRTADAMITDARGLALLWAFGDCAPIVLYDPRHTTIALVHAGWRGTAQAILPRTLDTMREHFGTRPEEVLVGIGPAIGACCYEVNEQVRATFQREPRAGASAVFERRPADAEHPNGRLFLDVGGSNERQLLAAGILPDHIENCGICTGCRTDLFYSNRKEPKPSGRFGVAVGLTDLPGAEGRQALRGGVHA